MTFHVRAFAAGLFATFCLAAPGLAAEPTNQQLAEEIERLKTEIRDMQASHTAKLAEALEEVDTLNEHHNNGVHISGYTDVEYRHSDQRGVTPSVRLHHLSLFLSQKVSEQWRFFSEIEYEDAPNFEATSPSSISDAEGKIFVEAVNIDFLWQPWLTFRFGRFFTPAGIWSVNHYPPFVPTQERPLHIRNIFPQLVDGALAHGSRPMGAGFLDYDVYAGNGEGNSGKQDQNTHKAVATRASWRLPDYHALEVGATAYRDRLNNRDTKTAYGMHLRFVLNRLAFQGEWAEARIDPVGGTEHAHQGLYTQLLYRWGNYAVGYRYDLFNQNNTQVRNSMMANYQVDENTVVKLEHHADDFSSAATEDRGTTILSLSLYLD
ncbi:MAG: hypothetical protein ACE5FN_10875 [Leptospirillia bacterium]